MFTEDRKRTNADSRGLRGRSSEIGGIYEGRFTDANCQGGPM
jgi:hypothetical protein